MREIWIAGRARRRALSIGLAVAGVASLVVLTGAAPRLPGDAPTGGPSAQDGALDTASIALEADGVLVRHRIPNLGDRVVALAIRVPEQRLDVTRVVREGRSLLDAGLTTEDDAYRFEVESGAPIVVEYRLSGSLDRIPLFVPAGRAELTVAREFEEPHLIRLTGPPERLAAIDTRTSLPRFERVSDGALEARLSSLPAFVRLSDRGPFSFGRVADMLALGLILLGAWWAWRRFRPRRTPPTR